MPPQCTGVGFFVRAVVTEMGRKRGGSGGKVIVMGKKVKNCGGKNVSYVMRVQAEYWVLVEDV